MSGGHIRMKMTLEASSYAWSKMDPAFLEIGSFRLKVTRGGPNSTADDVEKRLHEAIKGDLDHNGPIARAIREFAEQCEATKDSGVPADLNGNPI